MRLPIPFRHSIQLRLAAALSAALLLAALLAGGFAFYDSYRSTNKLQDDLLRQIAAHIDPNRLPENTESQRDAHIRIQTPAGDRTRSHDSDDDDDDHITLPANLPEGLHTFQEPDGDDTYRAYIRHTPQGPVAVLQENDFREDMAERAAWSSALPLILLAPLSILLTIFIVRRTMQPVHRLSQSLEARRSSDLAPLSTENIPNEIRGFIQAINRLLERTHQAMQQQQRFIADAAHELRSPLTALSLQAERLTKLPQSDEAREQTGLILQSIQRNRHLLEQLLTHARAQGSETQRNLTDISLQAQFRRVLQELMPLALDKQQDIGVAVENDLRIRADDTEIYTLIKTFTDNAIRYTPAGGRIDIGFSETPTTLTIWVEDDGPGIPAAERSRVTDAFYRILGTEQQGTGLGLSIADAIAKRYGGKLILADSRNFAHGLLIQAQLDKRLLKAD